MADPSREHDTQHFEPTAGAQRTPELLGRYRLIRRIDEGGMGTVFEAEHAHTGGRVAIKVVNRQVLTPAVRERFRREASAAARVAGPGICRVFDFDEVDGTPFLAMEFVEGRTLADILRDEAGEDRGSDEQARIRTHLEVLERCARSIDTVHEAGVVHRDLKPGNVMVRPDGMPVVLDFGLALDLCDRDHARLTEEGAAVGTLAYMAPEQFDDRVGPIDRRTDVYALGVMLFQALTLQLPFPSRTPGSLEMRIREGWPPRPQDLNSRVGKNLGAVCLKAMHREPHRRYASALELAEDLRRVLDGQPPLARNPSALDRLVPRVKRHRWPLAAGVAAAVAVLSFFGMRSASAQGDASGLAEFIRVANAYAHGAEPAEEDLAAARATVGDRWIGEASARLGAEPEVLFTLIADVARDLAGRQGDGEHTVTLLAPRARVQTRRPDFLLRLPNELPSDTGLDVVVRSAAGELARIPVPSPAVEPGNHVRVMLPDGVELPLLGMDDPPLAWNVEWRSSEASHLTPVAAEFRTAKPGTCEHINEDLPTDGEGAPLLARAARLLCAGLAGDARDELLEIPDDAPREVLAVRERLLAVAYCELGDMTSARAHDERAKRLARGDEP